VNEGTFTDDYSELPLSAFAFPGPLRDHLISAILDGRNVTTTSLALAYEITGEPLPCEGQRSVVVDSNNRPVCVIETLEVIIAPLGEVGYEYVVGEGEGHATFSDWRASHVRFWSAQAMTESLSDATLVLDDATPVVLGRFRVVERLRSTVN